MFINSPYSLNPYFELAIISKNQKLNVQGFAVFILVEKFANLDGT